MSAEERYLDELLGAYALDAVDADERRAVEEYLSMNPAAAAEVAEYREVAAMLTFSPAAAPDLVWSRIVDSIGNEAPPAPGAELAKVLPFDAPRRRRPSIVPWAVAAAAAVVAVLAVAVATRSSVDRPPLDVAFEQALENSESRVAVLASAESDDTAKAVINDRGVGFVDARQLPRLDPSQAYQLWGVVDDKVISLGVFGADPAIVSFTAEAPVSALAITIEAAGGVISDGNPDGAYSGALA